MGFLDAYEQAVKRIMILSILFSAGLSNPRNAFCKILSKYIFKRWKSKVDFLNFGLLHFYQFSNYFSL